MTELELNGQRNGADYSVYINTGQEVCDAFIEKNEYGLIRSTTAQIPELDPTKLYHGAKSVQEPRASK